MVFRTDDIHPESHFLKETPQWNTESHDEGDQEIADIVGHRAGHVERPRPVEEVGEAGQTIGVHPVERIRGLVLACSLKKTLPQQKGTATQDNRQHTQPQSRSQPMPQGKMKLGWSPVNNTKSRCHQGFGQTGNQPE